MSDASARALADHLALLGPAESLLPAGRRGRAPADRDVRARRAPVHVRERRQLRRRPALRGGARRPLPAGAAAAAGAVARGGRGRADLHRERLLLRRGVRASGARLRPHGRHGDRLLDERALPERRARARGGARRRARPPSSSAAATAARPPSTPTSRSLVPSDSTARIQELHVFFLHVVIDQVDAWAAGEQ